jgi:hypothetical protein
MSAEGATPTLLRRGEARPVDDAVDNWSSHASSTPLADVAVDNDIQDKPLHSPLSTARAPTASSWSSPRSEIGPPNCAICMFTISNPTVGGGCAHHFCFECYDEWARQKMSCPTCRAPIWNLKLDVEFAELCGAEITPTLPTSVKPAEEEPADPDMPIAPQAHGGRRTVHVAWPAGLTLANHMSYERPNGSTVVKVIKVMHGNGGHNAGIRVGDIIYTVNGAEVRDHATAVNFIEQRCRVGDCVVYWPQRSNSKPRMRAHLCVSAPPAPCTDGCMRALLRFRLLTSTHSNSGLGRQTSAWLGRIRTRVRAPRGASPASAMDVDPGDGLPELPPNPFELRSRSRSMGAPPPAMGAPLPARSWSAS